MTPCQISGCRRLETKCADCGRTTCTAMLPPMVEWIKCSDRLPEPWIDVLVWCQSTVSLSIAKDEYYPAIDKFCIWNDDHLPSFTTTRFFGIVIAWMPICPYIEEK